MCVLFRSLSRLRERRRNRQNCATAKGQIRAFVRALEEMKWMNFTNSRGNEWFVRSMWFKSLGIFDAAFSQEPMRIWLEFGHLSRFRISRGTLASHIGVREPRCRKWGQNFFIREQTLKKICSFSPYGWYSVTCNDWNAFRKLSCKLRLGSRRVSPDLS